MAINNSLVLQVMMLLVVVTIVFSMKYTGPKDGEKSRTYAQYTKWNAKLTGVMTMDFKTSQSTALLAYLDDGGDHDYLALQLERGRVKLSFKLGNYDIRFTLGENLNDSNWHTVKVFRNYSRCTLVIDSLMEERQSTGRDEMLTTKTDLFIGGLPPSFVLLTDLTETSTSSVPRFIGNIRNIFYQNDTQGRWVTPQLVAREGVEESALDPCATFNQCLNGGRCISFDRGKACNCSQTRYTGETCSEDPSTIMMSSEGTVESLPAKKTAAGTFDGETYFSYDLSTEGINSETDDITFEFRTHVPTGLIMVAASYYDYLYVALIDGRLQVKLNLGSGAFDRKMGTQSLSDNSWHRVNIRRGMQSVVITINDTLTEQGKTSGDYSTLAINSKFYVGGAPDLDLKDIIGSIVRENFTGHIRQLFYSNENMNLLLLERAQENGSKVEIFGNLVIGIEDVEELDPITFRKPESVLVVPKWDAGSTGSLSFSFRTIEADGLLMYSMGAEVNGDFFAIELYEGRLYTIINLGNGMVRSMPYKQIFNDGSWHNVVITRLERLTRVQVDLIEPKEINSIGTAHILNLADDLFLGGVDTRENSRPLPMEVYSITRQAGYVGCMRNLVLNGLAYNIAGEVLQQNIVGIKTMCKSRSPMCQDDPCRNGGKCIEGWNRFICDCSMTDFTGHVCDDNATVLSFNGNQHFLVDLGDNTQTKAEDITLRFSTFRPTSALLVIYSNTTVDFLKLELVDGVIKFSINFGTRVDSTTIGSNLANGGWHTIKVKRKQQELTLTLDTKETVQNWDDLSTQILDFRFVELGLNSNSGLMDLVPFIGLIEQFTFNSRDYIEMASNNPMDGIVIKNTASFGPLIDTRKIRGPITFTTKGSYIEHPSPFTYPSFGIFFHFRTVEANGLILYNKGDGKDFIAVELVDGYLHYLYDFGDQTVDMIANTVNPVNDNKWHEVDITSNNMVTRLKVDNSVQSRPPTSYSARWLDLIENMYFGGVASVDYEYLPDSIQSREGFLGCFASLEFNGRFRDMLTNALTEIPETIISGCEARVTQCTDDTCVNGGKCVGGWRDVYCDCSATSYRGVHCEKAGTTYMFGSYGGLISLKLASIDWRSVESDDITIGFATYSKQAVLMRVESANLADFIEICMDDGVLVAVYNLGSQLDYSIPTSPTKFNDGQFHVARLCRKGGNTTLTVDQVYSNSHTVPASDGTVFDNQANIYLGGKSGTEGRRRRRQTGSMFVGLLSGASVNDINPLLLASTGDPRTQVQGNVTLIADPTSFIKNGFTLPMPTYNVQTIKTPTINIQSAPTTTDDIFFSVTECNDDEECESQSGSGEDSLFTPSTDSTVSKETIEDSTSSDVFVQSSTTPIFICADDDEDCEGSGGGSDITDDPFTIFKTSKDDIITATMTNNDMAEIPRITKVQTLPPNAMTTLPLSLQSTSFIEQTGMIIGIAAGGVVILLLVILLLYKYRNRSEGSYKINESRNFDLHTVRSALLPARNGAIPAKAPKSQLPPEYATKEWYV